MWLVSEGGACAVCGHAGALALPSDIFGHTSAASCCGTFSPPSRSLPANSRNPNSGWRGFVRGKRPGDLRQRAQQRQRQRQRQRHRQRQKQPRRQRGAYARGGSGTARAGGNGDDEEEEQEEEEEEEEEEAAAEGADVSVEGWALTVAGRRTVAVVPAWGAPSSTQPLTTSASASPKAPFGPGFGVGGGTWGAFAIGRDEWTMVRLRP